MKKRFITLLIASHMLVGAIGFVIGIYLLPILIAPESPSVTQVNEMSENADYTAVFSRELADSDAFHWGEGKVFVGRETVSFIGELAPGPDYRLYLAKEFVETEDKFNQIQHQMVHIGHVNTFENFIVNVPEGVNPDQYNTVIVWCERFGEFITSAQYRKQ